MLTTYATTPYQTDIADLKPEFRFLIDKGFALQDYPKSLRYYKRSTNGALVEVTVRAQSLGKFMCEISKVVPQGTGRKVTSKSLKDASADQCLEFVTSFL